jgi:hypothetical protein
MRQYPKMSKLNQVGTHETSIYTSNGYICVKYHNTEVVRFNHERIVLNSNGWSTHTTKVRMNQASNQYGLGYKVYQRDYDWYIDFKGQTIEYKDKIELER